MAQPLSQAHEISGEARPSSRAASVLLLAGTGLLGLAVVAALALWFHYGTQVFFEMIRTGLLACF
jgi:hypothetical protein